MGITVAFLAQCQGSATIDEQKAHLADGDHVVVAGRRGFNKLTDILAQNGIRLAAGDRIRVYDLTCIKLSTTTLVRMLSRMLRKGIAFEIIAAGVVIEPNRDDKLHALLEALDGHNRYLPGIKTHPADRRGRKRLLDPEQLPEIRARLDRPGATATEVANDLGVARSTLFNFLGRYDDARRIDPDKKARSASPAPARE